MEKWSFPKPDNENISKNMKFTPKIETIDKNFKPQLTLYIMCSYQYSERTHVRDTLIFIGK